MRSTVQVQHLLIKECRYDEIRSLYVEQLAYIWTEAWTEATCMNIKKKISSFVRGDLEHAAETVSTLWKVINEDDDIKAPSSASSAVSLLWVCILCKSAHST